MEIGTFTHGVLELMMRRSKAHRTVAGARHHARWLWIAPDGLWGDDARPTSVARGEITEADFKRQAWLAITGLWDLEDPTQADVIATEEEIDWTEGDVPMKVIVDRVDRCGRDTLTPGLVVLDYKSGSVPKAKYRGAHKRQITIGAMAVASQEGPLSVAGAGALLYVGAETPVAIAAPTDRKARAAVSEAAQQVWADINAACSSEQFPATTSALCGWCSHVADCPEGQSYIRRAESSGWSWWAPEIPGARVVTALDAA